MKLTDRIVMCLTNLFRRKVRTLLTVTGVVVGTCAIVVMISIGVGMKESQDKMLEGMGDLTIIEVYNYSGQANANGDALILDDKAIAQLQALEHVRIATPIYQLYEFSMKLFDAEKQRYQIDYVNVVGLYPEALELLGYELIEGRALTDNDLAYTAVVGEYAMYQLRDTKKRSGRGDYINPPDPYMEEMEGVEQEEVEPFLPAIGTEFILQTYMQDEETAPIEKSVNIVGVIKQDYSRGWETYSGIFMNINDLKKLTAEYNKANGIKTNESKGYDNVRVKVDDIKNVSAVEKEIQALGFDTYSMESMREPLEESARQQQLVLGGLGAISLFVAALGITNTMIMSIYERTREIGVMKVLGCVLGNIRSVFLMEAGLIGFIGGVIGIGLSYCLSFLMNYFGVSLSLEGGMGVSSYMMGAGDGAARISIIPPWLVVLALVFATLIGLISGFYPANRAVKISALEAIKHD